ncbi:hypothetical protein CVT25_012177 [Psilocybe cyanescens]|uniref:Altered inheritance of mitochondria protein 41 n=1 Tax=Psilocybe cyanescens TaxID=93625 RepID=A0A409XFH3_PSICY|nr:hypothetical protein CVT25_012177 [Psilocybe cyanescens]
MTFVRAQLSFTSLAFRRHYSKATIPARNNRSVDPRPNLRNEIKVAMKSVLSEIDSAEKTAKVKLSSSDMNDAAQMFSSAKRPDLAEKEQKEVELLSKFVPPLMTVLEIDTHIRGMLANLTDANDPRKTLPMIFKEFYSKVDKSSVDRNLVKERAQELVESARLGKQ